MWMSDWTDRQKLRMKEKNSFKINFENERNEFKKHPIHS